MALGGRIEDFYRPGSLLMNVLRLLLEGFLWAGVILLVEAVVWLRRHWRLLPQSTKVLSVFSLIFTSILGSYLFHYLIPRLQSERASTR